MKYIGQERKDEVLRTYCVCSAETVEEEMQCREYRPCTEKERIENCHPAESFSCFWAECGCSDVCQKF